MASVFSLNDLSAYMRKSLGVVILALVLAALSAVLTIIGPDQVGKIATIMSDGLLGGIDLAAIARVGILLAVIYGLSALFGFIQHYIMASVTLKMSYRMRAELSEKINRVPQKYLVWNQSIGKKISAAEAAGADFGAHLEIGGAAVADQSSVSVLYSGFTSKWKVYSSTTTPPTEPGRYTMTVVVLGGNYLASPINRSFQITK